MQIVLRKLTCIFQRPDIRAPLWHVTKHEPSLITPGYWFVSPYAYWKNIPDRLEYTPYQVGPHIYDGNGVSQLYMRTSLMRLSDFFFQKDLVWSGAVIDHNRNAHDFKPYTVGNETVLSYISGTAADKSLDNAGGLFVMMDASYTKTADITSLPHPKADINTHEFNVLDNGRSALVLFFQVTDRNSTDIPGGNQVERPYLDDCIMEIDIATRKAEFEWCPLNNGVNPDESFAYDPVTEPIRDYL